MVGDTAIRLGAPVPLAGDSALWERLSDSAYAVRAPERFGAGYVRAYLDQEGLVRAVHYEILPRDWPPGRIAVLRACTLMTVCQIMDEADTSLVVEFVGDSLVQYDAWTHNIDWFTNRGTKRGILLDRTERSRHAPQN